MHALAGHTKAVTSLAVSPDSAHLFSAAKGQRTVWQWDLAARKPLRKHNFGSHAYGSAAALAVSPRGEFFLAAAEYRGLLLVPLAGEPPRLLDQWTGDPVYLGPCPGIAVHPDGRSVVASLERAARGNNAFGFQVWHLDEGTRREVGGHASSVVCLALSPDGQFVATGSTDGTVRLCDFASGTLVATITPRVKPVRSCFSPDGLTLAVAGGRSVLLFDARTGRLRAEAKGHAGNVRALAYSPDGRYLASAGADALLILRDAATSEIVGQRDPDLGKLGALAWRADSRGLFVGGDRHVGVCDLDELLVVEKKRAKPKGEPLSLAGHDARVYSMAYSPDARTLASQDYRTVHLWDLSAGAGQARERGYLSPQPQPWIGSVTWSRDSASFTVFRPAEVYDAVTLARRSGYPEQEITYLGHLPSGRLILFRAIDGWTRCRVSLFDPADHSERAAVVVEGSFRDHAPYPTSTADGDAVYFRRRRQAYRWDVGAGTVVVVSSQPTMVEGLALSADGRRLATVGGKRAYVWRLPDGERAAICEHPDTCSGAEFLSDGRLLTVAYDGVARVFDEGGTERMALDLGMGKAYCLAVSPDGMTFAVGVHKKNRVVLMDVPE